MHSCITFLYLALLLIIATVYAQTGDVEDEGSRVFRNCSHEELRRYEEMAMICELPACLREKAVGYIAQVGEKYPDEQEARVGIQFAACECSCAAEECEVQQIKEAAKDQLSLECKASLLKKCSLNDERLTERCTALTGEFPEVYDARLNDDPLGFADKCHSCSAELVSLGSVLTPSIADEGVPSSFVEQESGESPDEDVATPEDESSEPLEEGGSLHTHVINAATLFCLFSAIVLV